MKVLREEPEGNPLKIKEINFKNRINPDIKWLFFQNFHPNQRV